MTTFKLNFLIALIFITPYNILAQKIGLDQIKAAGLKVTIDFIASDKMKGRKTGEDGNNITARFLASQASQIGLKPLDEKGTFLQTFEPKRFDLDFSLDQIQRLVNPNQFFRINRNFLINFASIVQIHLFSSSRLKVEIQNQDPKEEILVSREKVTDFKAWLDR